MKNTMVQDLLSPNCGQKKLQLLVLFIDDGPSLFGGVNVYYTQDQMLKSHLNYKTVKYGITRSRKTIPH